MATSRGAHAASHGRASRTRTAGRRHCQPGAGSRAAGPPLDCEVRVQVSQPARRYGASLFNQQMWCWGCDVRRAEGNLLIAYGFERHAPPPDTRYNSSYHLQLSPDQSCALWGFGMHYRDAAVGAMFLKRFGFTPELLSDNAPPTSAFEPAHLSPARSLVTRADSTSARDLLVTSLRWIAAYEEWVQATVGVEHRRQTLETWRSMRKRVVTEPDAVAAAWRSLADECAH